MLDFTSYTQRARNILIAAKEEARKLQALEVGSSHFLLAMAVEKGSVAERAFEEMQIPYETLLQAVKLLHHVKGNDSTGLALSAEAKNLLDLALDSSKRMGNPFIGTEHLLLGLLRQSDSDAVKILSDNGFTRERVQEIVYGILEIKMS